MNQSEFLAITWNSLEAREESRVHGAIGFGFASDWLKNWRESRNYFWQSFENCSNASSDKSLNGIGSLIKHATILSHGR